MGKEVEHRHGIDADTCGDEHIAQLRTGGIGNHTLDVILHKAHSGREKCRCCAQDRDKGHRLGGVFHQWRHAAHEVDPRRHHCRGVNKGGHRCRPFHRIRQPCVQDQLRRFPHRADKEQKGQ